MTSPATTRRLQVLDLRIRLERLGAKSFDDVGRPVRAGRQSEVQAHRSHPSRHERTIAPDDAGYGLASRVGEEFLAGDAFIPVAPQDRFIREADVFSCGSGHTAG